MPFGYDRLRDEESGAIEEQIIGPKAAAIVTRILENQTYAGRRTHAVKKGKVLLDVRVTEGTWPPIIDSGKFDRVQAMQVHKRKSHSWPKQNWASCWSARSTTTSQMARE